MIFRGLIGLISASFALPAAAGAPPLEAFARFPAMTNLSISEDGRYLAYITELADQRTAVVFDRHGEQQPKPVITASHAEGVDIAWCKWANNTRLLCGLFGTRSGSNRGSMARTTTPKTTVVVTRIMAVNADGSELKQLMDVGVFSQFQDRILDWTPNDPDHVLIEVDHNRDAHPSVFELDIHSGQLTMKMGQHSVINRYWSDGKGEVRLGRGTVGSDTMWYARGVGKSDWVQLSKFATFAEDEPLVPLAVEPGQDAFLFRAKYQGRDAVWRRALQGDAEATVAHSDASFDLQHPIFSGSGRLIGFSYNDDKPGALYIDARAKSVIAAADKLLPNMSNAILTSTPDQKVYLLRSTSDVQAGQYSILDTGTQPVQLKYVGSEYPELDRLKLPHVEPSVFPTRSGSHLSAYLFQPPGAQQARQPLVVLPRGGPMSREALTFFFLRNFLISRGYAVLHLSFPDASGYEREWFKGAHQDWGGLTHEDVVEATRWAIDREHIDAQRVCIVGWGFGGYLAQLAAIREKELFRCAASIAGVSDVLDFKDYWRVFFESRLIRQRIGSDVEKLRADSPARHAAAANIPILLIHGDDDWQVPVAQTRDMVAALEAANKPHEAIIIKDGNHQLRWQSDRTQLLQAIERFLQQHLGATE
jgi:dipeptidyl aminopeptidase/acylaminoacyl peptidase